MQSSWGGSVVPLEQEINCSRITERIIEAALDQNASDIHIEPLQETLRVRFRVDGLLHCFCELPMNLHNGIISRLKIIGGMDIAEKRVPQDGRIEWSCGIGKADIRASVLPTVSGEKIVLRLFSKEENYFKLENLDLSDEILKIYGKILKGNKGLFLLSGPTGSGKTTTLYAVLRELNNGSRNITTIEDPVEYRLQGVNQIAVNKKTGLTFAGGLAAMVRQDPDIIMVGEIRDVETARIAIQAALTGHAVFSTIHANSAAGIIYRLLEMGIEPYLLTATVTGTAAQRLVRRNCCNCARPAKASPAEKDYLNLGGGAVQELWRSVGCSLCGYTGFKGRIAVHEVMLLSGTLGSLIIQRAEERIFSGAAEKEGYISLRQDGISKVLKGLTTVEELWRAGI